MERVFACHLGGDVHSNVITSLICYGQVLAEITYDLATGLRVVLNVQILVLSVRPEDIVCKSQYYFPAVGLLPFDAVREGVDSCAATFLSREGYMIPYGCACYVPGICSGGHCNHCPQSAPEISDLTFRCVF